MFFFFKQKPADEMRISDWSSDVCSSDLAAAAGHGTSAGLRAVAEKVKARPGGPPRLLVAKPGLDGHSNGAEQIAVAARDRSEEHRGGKESVRTCRYRWAPAN